MNFRCECFYENDWALWIFCSGIPFLFSTSDVLGGLVVILASGVLIPGSVEILRMG